MTRSLHTLKRAVHSGCLRASPSKAGSKWGGSEWHSFALSVGKLTLVVWQEDAFRSFKPSPQQRLHKTDKQPRAADDEVGRVSFVFRCEGRRRRWGYVAATYQISLDEVFCVSVMRDASLQYCDPLCPNWWVVLKAQCLWCLGKITNSWVTVDRWWGNMVTSLQADLLIIEI